MDRFRLPGRHQPDRFDRCDDTGAELAGWPNHDRCHRGRPAAGVAQRNDHATGRGERPVQLPGLHPAIPSPPRRLRVPFEGAGWHLEPRSDYPHRRQSDTGEGCRQRYPGDGGRDGGTGRGRGHHRQAIRQRLVPLHREEGRRLFHRVERRPDRFEHGSVLRREERPDQSERRRGTRRRPGDASPAAVLQPQRRPGLREVHRSRRRPISGTGRLPGIERELRPPLHLPVEGEQAGARLPRRGDGQGKGSAEHGDCGPGGRGRVRRFRGSPGRIQRADPRHHRRTARRRLREAGTHRHGREMGHARPQQHRRGRPVRWSGHRELHGHHQRQTGRPAGPSGHHQLGRATGE